MSDVRFFINDIECSGVSDFYAAGSEHYYNMHWWNKVNSIRQFRGRKPGEAHLLITQELIDSAPLEPASSSAVNLKVRYDGTTHDFGNWFVSKIEAIETLYQYTNAQKFYIELKDPKWVADNTFVADSWSILSDTFNYVNESTMLWQDVLDALWNLMPTDAYQNSGTCPTLEGTPVSSAENLNFDGISVWRAICQTLEACGHFPVYDHVNGTYRFARYFQTQAGLSTLFTNALPRLIWQNYGISLQHNVPEDISLIFQPQLHSRITHSTFAKPHVSTIPSGAAGSVSGTNISIVDTTFCILTDGIMTNQTQMDNRVLDIRPTIQGKANASSNGYVQAYRGILPQFLPGEEITSVVIADSPRRSDYTQVELLEPFEFDLPKPPDRAYSLVEVVLITSNAPDGDGYYDGTVQRWNHDTLAWDNLYSCKVKDISL